MAKKVTPEDIAKMIALYKELKTYSAVAKATGFSASTVSRYIKEAQSTRSYTSAPAAKPIEEIDIQSVLSFSTLSDIEKQSYKNWLKEFNRNDFYLG